MGVADLNGDGRYDFVIKTPDSNIDPFQRNWRPSENTYKLEAYLSDGTFLWRKDLGWNIETGIWYSSYIVHDFSGDGREAIIYGAAAVDGNGNGIWSANLGHPDNVWVGDIDPARPGLEVYLGIEGARVKGNRRHGISLWDARTGTFLWGLEHTSYHIHGWGLVSNIVAEHVGMECYSGEQQRPNRWLHNARGELIADEKTWHMRTLRPRAVYWDDRPERELLVEGRIFRHPDETIADHVEGNDVAWVDLFGDWREEIITSVPGELRIYATPIPAADRRVTLMQDPLYRNGVAHLSMGYGQPPLTSYYIGRPAPVAR
ncbi:MAG: hypothetical protein GXY44_03825 [Phycisphaerales bacterium]|nr:hypothetical protein [Phycisphaerales bacterium]